MAAALRSLSARLHDLGRREEALTLAQEAVDIHRELTATRPDSFRPELAWSLHVLAIMFYDLGRRQV
jgi:hypothetical protein